MFINTFGSRAFSIPSHSCLKEAYQSKESDDNEKTITRSTLSSPLSSDSSLSVYEILHIKWMYLEFNSR